MKKNMQLVKNKKGLSTLFVAIYVALLAIVIISTLFYGLSISHSSLASYLGNEQDRMQERILVKKLNVSETQNEIAFVLVNNTGGITVRIRSIYIDEKFTCDPSKFSGDSYIAPQSSKWIVLSPFHIGLNETTIQGNWTITTERGTKSTDTGTNLLSNTNYNDDPNKLYFGPLLLLFNQFAWSNDNGISWNDGWTIPQTPGDVIWRIKVTDIDERPIILNSGSSFALVQNSKIPNKIATWKIGPANLNPENLTLWPGIPVPLFFSVDGPNSLDYMNTPIPIASNFLTILGNFIEPDGSLPGFAQTIPFEAVKISGLPEIITHTTLNAISSPQTVGQSVAVSGQVTVDPGNKTVPGNGVVVIQYRALGSNEWLNILNPVITTGNGGPFTGSFTPPHAGTYEYRAIYMGDAGGQDVWAYSASLPQTISVNKASSTVTVQALPPLTIGQSTSATATVNPSYATGTVTFEVSTNNGTSYTTLSTNPIVSGSAVSNSYTPSAPGNNYRFRATYNGDADVLSSPTSTPITLIVNKANPTLTTPILIPASPITIGQSVTATVTITGSAGVASPTGNVTFQYSANGGPWTNFDTQTLTSNSATSNPYTPVLAGSNLFRIRAVYSGDNNYNTVTSGAAPLIVKTYPAITVPTLTPASPIFFGTSVTVRVTVSGTYGTPTGNVDFQVSTDNWTTYTNVGTTKLLTAGGLATSDPYLAPSVGNNYQFRAVYAGDNNYLGIQSLPSVNLTVNQAISTTSLTLSSSLVPVGQPVTATATVSPLSATGNVTFEVSTNGIDYGLLGGSVPLVSGSATSISFTPSAPGIDYRFRATYSGDNNVLGSTGTVSLAVFGPLDHFVFQTIGPQIAGTAFSITMTAEDSNGVRVADYNGSNSLAVSVGTISPISTGNFINGIRSMQVTVTTASPSVNITTTNGGASGTSNNFTVNPGALSNFSFAPISTPQTAGAPFSITITAQDANGNTVTSYTGANTLTVSTGIITPTSTTAFSNGSWVGTVTLTRAGTGITIGTTGGAPTRSGTSNTFTVTAGSLDHFTFNTIGNQIEGVSFGITITAQDAYNNTATNYAGTNNLADLFNTVSPTSTGVFTGGVWTGSVSISSRTQADNITTTGGGKSGTSNTFIVTGQLDHFNFNTISNQTAGTPFSITITAVDSSNSTITGYSGTNNLTVSTGLINPNSSGSFLNGVRTISVTLTTAGSNISISTTGGSPAQSGTSNAFNVIPSALDHFTMTGYPGSTTAGQVFNGVNVTAFDIYNNIKTNYLGQTYFTSTDPQAILLFNSTSKYTFSGGDQGTHIFNGFALKTAGPRTITVRDDSALKTLTSSPITVNPASVDHLSFGTINSPQTINLNFTITITAKDLYNNTATGYSSSTILNASTGAGTINPASVVFTNGQWSGPVALNRTGIGIIISAIDGTVTGTSNLFNVYGALALNSTINPPSFRTGTNQQYTVTITNLAIGNTLGSATIAIPAGFSVSLATIQSASGHSWTATVSAGMISISANAGNDPLNLAESVVVSFTPTQTPSNGITYTWNTTAYTSRTWGGTTFNAPNPQPKTIIQYYLTVTSARGSSTGQGWYDSGTSAYASLNSAIIGGAAGTQYNFTNWSTDASGTNYLQSSSITMNSNKTATANWQTQYYLTVTSNHGSPSPSSGWYPTGTLITASVSSPADITADTRYRCTGYSGTGDLSSGGPASPVTFTITRPSSITWNWITQYQLTLFTSPIAVGNTHISASPASGDGFYDIGTSVSLTASTSIPIDSSSRYQFNQWSGDTTGSSNAISVTIDSPKSVTANYQTQYAITASAGPNGAIDPSGTIFVNAGSSQTFTITPNTNYHIADVLVNGASAGTGASQTLNNIQAAQTISASFTIDTFIIASSASADGSISPSGTISVNYGDNQTFAIAATTTGYHIADVIVDGSSVGGVSTYIFSNVQANHTITATFAINTYTITPSADANGAISPSTVQTVNFGDTPSFTVTPTTGYHILDVTADGVSVLGSLVGNDYTFPPVSANHVINATFAIDT